jgi:hypothetical protein
VTLDAEKKLRLWADMAMHISEGSPESFWATPVYSMKYGINDFEDLFTYADESICVLQKEYIEEKIKSLKKELKKIRTDLESYRYDRLTEYQKEISCSYCKKVLYDRYCGQAFESRCENYKEDFEEFVLFLERFPAILSTVDSLKDSVRRNYVYDYLIIDDASETGLHSGIKILSCCKNVVFVGDTKKPSPNLMSSAIGVFGDSAPCTVLREQYLCHPDVIRFVNEEVYDNELIAYKENEPLDADRAYFLRQTDGIAQTLKKSFDNDDITRFTDYTLVDENKLEDKIIPVFDLLYSDFNSVLISLQKSVLKRAKYKSIMLLYKKIGDILADDKYKHLRFRYNLRMSDILAVKGSGTDAEAYIKKATVDFAVYSVFGKKPELVIESGEKDLRKDSILNNYGISVIWASAGTGDFVRQMIYYLYKLFAV